MKRVVLALAVALVLAAAGVRAQGQAVAIRNVTVISGTGAPAAPGMTVVITGNRITDIGKDVKVPAQAQVVDGTGKFLMPGMWDMHIHIHRWDEFPLLLGNGVTGVRLMAFLPEYYKMRADIQSGKLLGPRFSISSRVIDGVVPNQVLPPASGDTAGEAEEFRRVEHGEATPYAYQVANAADAQRVVAESKKVGTEFLKIHNALTPDPYFAIAAEAKKQGMYMTGHVPTAVSVAKLAETGMRSIEHFGGMLEGCSSREDEILKMELDALALPQPQRAKANQDARRMAVQSFSADKCAKLAAVFVKNDTWLSPTFMPEGGVKADSVRGADWIKYIPAELRGNWLKTAAAAREPAPLSPEDAELARAVENENRQIVMIMQRGGVGFLAGTDTGRAWRFSGFDLHTDLAEEVRLGLTPMQVLQSATSGPARFLKIKDLGTVEKGKFADLVLLDADPLQNIANTRKVNAVVLNGRLLDRKTLDDMLAQLAATNSTN
jgi:imidazolonepropionase-like amidohydrolase